MEAVNDVMLAILAAGALAAAGWWLFGRIVAPSGGAARVCAVISAAGDGREMEQALRGLIWLRGRGPVRLDAVIADCGLDEMGRRTAAALVRRTAGLCVCTPEELTAYIRERARDSSGPAAPG